MNSPVKDTVLRMALTAWSVAPDHGTTPAQHAWLTARLKDQTSLTPEERARVRAPLLTWAARIGGERLTAVLERQYAKATLDLQEVSL